MVRILLFVAYGVDVGRRLLQPSWPDVEGPDVVEEHLDEHEGHDGLRVAPELGEMGDLRGHPTASREEGERDEVEGPNEGPPYLPCNFNMFAIGLSMIVVFF